MRRKLDNPVVTALLGAAGLLLLPRLNRPEVGSQPPRPTRPSAAIKTTAHKRRPERTGAAPRDGRGRNADSPADIPPAGWWEIAKRTANDISGNALMTQAAAITFYALLSLFPALAALVSIYGLIADPRTILDQMQGLSAVLPGGGMQLLTDQLKSLASADNKGLGWGVVIGVLTSMWTANQAMKAVFGALNVVNDEEEKRGFVKLTATTLAFTAGVIMFVVIALAGVVAVPAMLNFIGFGPTIDTLLNWLRWPVLLVIVGLMLALIYRYGPSRDDAKWRWISYGSAFAAVAWVIMSLLFSWYVAHFGNYNKTYGSLGAVVGFMTWIWLSATVVLIGAQLDAEMERQTARDTTTGPEQPIGTRRATPADRVAA
jgi:membrane protein